MKLGDLPSGHDALLFSISGTGSSRGGSRNSLGGGGSGPEFFEGGGGLGSRSVGIFIY